MTNNNNNQNQLTETFEREDGYRRERTYKRSSDGMRWFRRDFERMASGNEYTEYYMQATTNNGGEGSENEGYYNSCTEEEWNNLRGR